MVRKKRQRKVKRKMQPKVKKKMQPKVKKEVQQKVKKKTFYCRTVSKDVAQSESVSYVVTSASAINRKSPSWSGSLQPRKRKKKQNHKTNTKEVHIKCAVHNLQNMVDIYHNYCKPTSKYSKHFLEKHNFLEKTRRADLKKSFFALGAEVPQLHRQYQLPSKIKILKKATEYINELHELDSSLELELTVERTKQQILIKRLLLLQKH